MDRLVHNDSGIPYVKCPLWAFSDIEGTDMKRINVWYFYALASNIAPLKYLRPEMPWPDLSMTSWLAHFALERLDKAPYAEVPLKKCLPEANALIHELWKITTAKEPRTDLEVADMLGIRWAAEKFEISLEIELRDMDTFYVPPVGIYSTSALLTRAEEMFGENRNLLPEVTIKQIKEAGKCLAFSLGSAAAFHLFSALESVLREYYDKLSGGASPPKNPSMGAYLGELSKLTGVDKKLLAALWQVKDLHRNPAIHFETLLETGEALTLVGMIHSAIATTLDVVSKLPTTSPAKP